MLILLAIIASLTMTAARADFTTPDCPAVKQTEFRYVKVVTKTNDPTLEQPLKVAPAPLENGMVDLYFIERHGKIKRWNAKSNTITVLATLDAWTDAPGKEDSVGKAENGLTGIALDPAFSKNKWLYVRYDPFEKEVYRISRFEVQGDAIPLSTEKILLEIPYVREHTRLQPIVLGGAGMAFDAQGNLLVNIGANTELSPSVNEKYRDFSAEYTSANMRSMRGAILRIHPDDSPRGYSIPKGNFGEYWSEQFKAQGKDALSEAYKDTSKVKPEIYIKGVRHPYSITVDQKRGWVAWGEFGPNRMGLTKIEELNVAKHPIYGGYPYWAGKHEFLLDGMQPWAGAKMDPKAPVNNSVWNDGPKELPPSDTPKYAYSAYTNNGFLVGNHPISGPIYHYDPESPSSVKMPPHFDKAWFMSERDTESLRALKLDETGSLVVDSMLVNVGSRLNRPLDLQQGPDGALYVVDYWDGWHSTKPQVNIGRIEYTGSCHPGVQVAVRAAGNGKPNLHIGPGVIEIREAGEHIVRQTDLGGREIRTWKGTGPNRYEPVRQAGNGVSLITVTFPATRKSATKLIMRP